MKTKCLLLLVSLLWGSSLFADVKISYKDKKDADEYMVALSHQAYQLGEYMKCIEYADSIHDSLRGYINQDVSRVNALIHALAAAAYFKLSEYQQHDLKADNLLKRATLHYLDCVYYFKEIFVKRKIDSYTNKDMFERLCIELDLVMVANNAAQAYARIMSFYDKSDKQLLHEFEKEGKLFENYLTKQILPNKHIVKENISLYYYLYENEIGQELVNSTNQKNRISVINNYLNEIAKTINNIGHPQHNKLTYIDLRNNMERMSKMVSTLAHYDKIDYEYAADVHINYLNLCDYIDGMQKYFKKTSWVDLKSTLKMGEYVLLFYEAPISKGTYYHVSEQQMNRFYAFVIGWDKDNITILNRKLNNTISVEQMTEWQTWWPGMESVYILPTEHMKTLDCAGLNKNVYMIMSLNTLFLKRNNNITSYKIKMMGNLKYSKFDTQNINSLKKGIGYYPLHGTKEEIIFLQNNLPSEHLEIIEGEQGTKRALLQKGNENILHISTHGDVDQNLLNQLNLIEPYDGITGDNVLHSCFLALSMYNDTQHRITHNGQLSRKNIDTYVSGFDIKACDFNHLDLVFLDACKTAYAKTIQGKSYSLAEAFRMAGAKNIIAYLEPIEDDIATIFAKYFYTNLFLGMNIHDSFYEAKNALSEYIPSPNIILWE